MSFAKWKKHLAVAACACLAAGTLLAGCGKSEEPAQEAPVATETEEPAAAAEETEAAAETDDSAEATETAEAKEVEQVGTVKAGLLIAGGVNSYFYPEYEENPIYKYWNQQVWDADGDGQGYNVEIDFLEPTPGSEQDYVNTLLATGDYPEVMYLGNITESVSQLYEDGIAQDLTEYIDQYMPNYKKWMDAHPDIAAMMYNNIDGEKKLLQLCNLKDAEQDRWGGWCYRRDWIVKYGKNPETGEAFTGGWNEDRTEWTDDVVFPSGNTNPVYISDWEWMMPIFVEALEDQGIDDGYAMQITYAGYYMLGDLVSGFGGNSGGWNIDKDGKCVFGGTTDGFRAYLECMRDWYAKGWIDQSFDENTSDLMFWKVDTPTVFSGKVGCWFGQTSSLGNSIQTDSAVEGDPVYGISVYGAPSPINDKYGDKSVQGTEPTCTFGTSIVEKGFILTDKVVSNKVDVPTLLTAFDALYDGEDWSLYRWYGFSDEKQAELQDEFYNEWGLQDGAYSVETVDGEEVVIRNQATRAEDNLDNACCMQRMPGLAVIGRVDEGYNSSQQQAVDAWMTYPSTGTILDVVTSQLTSDQSSEYSMIMTNVRTYMEMEVPSYIKGGRDIEDDKDWADFCKGLEDYGVQNYCDYINAIIQ